MGKLISVDNEYKAWLSDLKVRIKKSQLKASVRINTEMLELYWSIGADIVERQAENKWGSGVIPQLSKDLNKEFPDAKGFSATNLKYMKHFFSFYTQNPLIGQQAVDQLPKAITPIGQQAVDQLELAENYVSQTPCMLIPWGHNILIFTKSNSLEEALFYVRQTIDNGWSRSELTKHIKGNLYHKHGAAPNNFEITLPDAQSTLAKEMTRDPYNFDFVASSLRDGYIETELEDALTRNITDFLLELGQGFAYMV